MTNGMNWIVLPAGLATIASLSACDRRDFEDGLARIPENFARAACLSADNCTVICKDGSEKSRTFPHRCEGE